MNQCLRNKLIMLTFLCYMYIEKNLKCTFQFRSIYFIYANPCIQISWNLVQFKLFKLFKTLNLTFQILFENLSHVYLRCFVAIQFETFPPFPVQRFEQIPTLLFCYALDTTKWLQYSKGNHSNLKKIQVATTPNKELDMTCGWCI